MKSPRWSRDAGLTLVELLVVLAVVSLLTGLMAAGLRSATHGWQRTVRYNAQSEELHRVVTTIRGLLQSIYPEKTGSPLRRVINFRGDQTRLQFLAPLAQRFGAEDIVLYSLDFADDGTLRIAWGLDRRSTEPDRSAAAPRYEDRLDGFSAGSISYFGARDGGLRWWDSWSDMERLPRLIRIRFVMRGQSENMIVSPRIDSVLSAAEDIF